LSPSEEGLIPLEFGAVIEVPKAGPTAMMRARLAWGGRQAARTEHGVALGNPSTSPLGHR
jgi:hypothetical protein